MDRMAVSHTPTDSDDWLELLFDGLTFDLSGLGSRLSTQDIPANQFDINLSGQDSHSRATLRLGPHIASAMAVPGVVRAQLQLLSHLCDMPGIVAVGWAPADSLMSAGYFKRIVENWLGGGPFPALGITALGRNESKKLHSVGLSYFTGQEIEVPVIDKSESSAAKLAVRVIDYLVEYGFVTQEQEIEGPNGGVLVLSPEANGKMVRVKS